MEAITVCRPGRVDYGEALGLQEKLVSARQSGWIGDTLLLLEHPPVLTLGTRGKTENIYLNLTELEYRGIQIHQVNRGGDVTYHGPGQLIAYPIFRLGGVREFVGNLQDTIIRMLADDYHIESEARSGKMTGVWIGDLKIAAIGLAVRHGISMHGYAFNINTDLSHFDWINPCGLSMGVTSLAAQLGCQVPLELAAGQIIRQFESVFDRQIVEISRADLEQKAGAENEQSASGR